MKAVEDNKICMLIRNRQPKLKGNLWNGNN